MINNKCDTRESTTIFVYKKAVMTGIAYIAFIAYKLYLCSYIGYIDFQHDNTQHDLLYTMPNSVSLLVSLLKI